MILQDKTTGVKVVLDINEINLDDLKDTANRICRANQQIFDRTLMASHLTESEDIKLQKMFIKQVKEQVERSEKSILRDERPTPTPNLRLEEARFTEVFLPELGNLIIV